MLRFVVSSIAPSCGAPYARVALICFSVFALTILHSPACAADCESEKQDLQELLDTINGPDYDDGKGCLRETGLADYDERMASFYRECGAEIGVADPQRTAASHEKMARSARQAAAMACQFPDR
jgi:hypothetical protein